MKNIRILIPLLRNRSNQQADIIAPLLSSATIEDANPTNVVMVFDEAVVMTNLVANGFTIAGTTSAAFTSISGSGTTWTGVLAVAAIFGETITIAYNSGTGDVVDTATPTPNALATFGATAVTNNVALITELLGADLAVNGTFEAPGTGWTATSVSTVNTGVGRVYSTDGSATSIYQSTNYLTVGKLYRIDFDVVYNLNTNNLANSSGTQIYDNLTTGASKTFYYTADSTQLYFKRVNGGVTDIHLDNIVVREVLYQRLEFDAALTTPSAGSLTNVYGDPWTVVRNSVANYKNAGLLNSAAINVARVGDGVVTIEGVNKNELLYSKDYSNAVWTKNNATIIPNATAAPDGTVTADKIVGTNGNASFKRVGQSFTPDAAYSPQFIYCYAKAAEIGWLVMYHVGANKGKYFNLNTGVVGDNFNGAPFKAWMENLGNGWYKCMMQISSVTGTAGDVRFYTAEFGTATEWTSDGVKGMYLGESGADSTFRAYEAISTTASIVTSEEDIITIPTPIGVTSIDIYKNGALWRNDNHIPSVYKMLDKTSKIIMSNATPYDTGLPVSGVRVLVLSGQSNADGRGSNQDALVAELLANPNLRIWNPDISDWDDLTINGNNNDSSAVEDTHGLELELAIQFMTSFPNELLYLVKRAEGGRILSYFLPTGTVHEDMMKLYFNPAMNNLIEQGKRPFCYYSFWQGESDATSPSFTSDYSANLDILIARWRENIGNNLPFNFIEIKEVDNAVNAATINGVFATKDGGSAFINTISAADLQAIDGDSLHFGYGTLKTVANRLLSSLVAQTPLEYPVFPSAKSSFDVVYDGTPCSPFVEGDALTGWSTTGTTVASSTDKAYPGGTRSLKITATVGSFDQAYFTSTVAIGDRIEVSVWLNTVAPDAWIRNWARVDAFTDIPVIADGQWHRYQVTTVANAAGAGTFRFYACKDAGSINDVLYLDGLQIKRYI